MFAPANARYNARVCVVAEIGVNHDGKRDRALELIHAAKRIGATAVKFQLFDPAQLLSNQAQLAGYQRENDSSVFDMLDRLKLGADDFRQLRAEARRLGIHFVLTPFSLEDVELLADLHVDAVKIASPDVVNTPLIKATAELGKPMFVSTGTADLEELAPCVELIVDQPACLLHCVSSYPTPVEDATLGALPTMAARYCMPVGYSDHTNELSMGALAVAAGACVIEKHLTYDRRAPGPDHAASFDADQFARYIALIRQAQTLLGPRCKHVRGVEEEVRVISRQSVCAKHDLKAGDPIHRCDVTIKRPGTGIPAADFESILGRRLARDVKANDLLQDDDLA
jgi:N-acetylneuraminate synthase/N,N'-diacetyllegionaminate synthase